MKALWKRFQVGAIVVSACMLVLGIIMLVWPEISAITVCMILGALCVVAGMYKLVRYFRIGFAGVFFRFDLGAGILYTLAGLLLLIHPQDAMTILPMAAGIYILFGSVMDIQIAVEMHRFGLGNWVLSLILGILDTCLGFYLLFNPFSGAAALMMAIGICLIIGSIQNLYSVFCISKAVRNSKKDRIIDVEWSPMDF